MVNWGAVANALVLNHRLTDRSSSGSVGSPLRFGRWVPNPANALLLVACVTAMGMPDCSVRTPVTVQSFTSAPSPPLRLVAPIRAERQIPDGRRHEDVRNVARRVVAFESTVEAVGYRVVGNRSGQNRRVKHRRGIVDELRSRVAHEIRHAVREALLELEVDAVVERRSDVVPVKTDGGVLRVRLEQLSDGDRRIAERRGARNRAEERIRHALQERCALAELFDGQLIEVGVGNADVGDLRADVGNLDRDVRRELALKRRVPLLNVARSQIAIDGEHTLSKAGVRRQRNGIHVEGR